MFNINITQLVSRITKHFPDAQIELGMKRTKEIEIILRVPCNGQTLGIASGLELGFRDIDVDRATFLIIDSMHEGISKYKV
tara:strand:- start:614 stop:856 length:243 start_codon:yes stop_codon:yes gene_type:complete